MGAYSASVRAPGPRGSALGVTGRFPLARGGFMPRPGHVRWSVPAGSSP